MWKLGYMMIVLSISFIFALNLFLRGRMRQSIELVSTWLLVALSIVAFFLFHWTFAIFVPPVAFFAGRVFRPIAQLLASRIMGYRTGIEGAEWKEGAGQMQDMLERRITMQEYFAKGESEKAARAKRFENILAARNMQPLVHMHKLTPQTMEDLYRYLGSCGLAELTWDILSNPRSLQRLITLHEENKPWDEVYVAFTEL